MKFEAVVANPHIVQIGVQMLNFWMMNDSVHTEDLHQNPKQILRLFNI